MALVGQGALAMWWDMAAAMRPEFEHWHSHEHFPERLALPGFSRASRWLDARGGEGVFVLYELESYEVLSSPAYLARLNAPTPWSTQLMPHHRNMVRCQCRVLASQGTGLARHALTLRLPAAADTQVLQQALPSWGARPGLTGAHLLRHQQPAIAATTEQKLRGQDAVADQVLVVTAYDPGALEALLRDELRNVGGVAGLYELSATATPADVADLSSPVGRGEPAGEPRLP